MERFGMNIDESKELSQLESIIMKSIIKEKEGEER